MDETNKPEPTTDLNDVFYPKIESKGLTRDLGNNTEIEEKIDGSQMSFTQLETLVFFNRGRVLQEPWDDVFHRAATMLKAHFDDQSLNRDYIYHGEVIRKLRHNKIEYTRVPRFYFILFDIYDKVANRWLTHPEIKTEGERLHLEVIQLYWRGSVDPATPDITIQTIAKNIVSQMETGEVTSMLGGIPEGVVVKNPKCYDAKGREYAAKIKHVRTQFKELHGLKSKPQLATPDANSIFNHIMECFPREPRWEKSIQRMRDQSRLMPDPTQNVTLLVRDIKRDFKEECSKILMKYLELEMLPLMINEFTEGFEGYYLAKPSEHTE